MKKFSWIKVILLSIITCGLYFIYTLYTIHKNNNKIAEKYGIKTTMNFFLAWLLGIVTGGLFMLYWYYTLMNQQCEIAKATKAKITPSDSPIVQLLIVYFVPIYNYYVLCENYNNGVDAA